MATDKRAGIEEDKEHKREWVKRLVLVAFVLLGSGAFVWWDASQRADLDATLEALIEEEKKFRAEVEELRERIERHRLSH